MTSCHNCTGRGSIFVDCPDCEDGVDEDYDLACETCMGYGFIEKPCRKCHGTGKIDAAKPI